MKIQVTTVVRGVMARFRCTWGRNPKYFVDDREVTRAEFDAAWESRRGLRLSRPLEAGDVPLASSGKSCWPMKSEAMACHPKQIEEIMKRDRKHGVPTCRDRVGRPILTSRAHRKALMRLEGYHDNNGGYGD
jgi:hypothetical protein